MVAERVADGRKVRVDLGVWDNVGTGLVVGSGVPVGTEISLIGVGNEIVGGKVGSGTKIPSNTEQPVKVRVITTSKVIFLHMIVSRFVIFSNRNHTAFANRRVASFEIRIMITACHLRRLTYNLIMAYLSRSLSFFVQNLRQRVPWRLFLFGLLIVVLFIWLYFSPDGVLGKADSIGYAVCHRIAHRSFKIGETQFSVCARCTGQYLGALLSILFLSVFRPYRTGRPPWVIIIILLFFGLAYALDGFNSFLHLVPGFERFWLYEPNNTYRLITGTGVGLGIGVMLFPAFNQTVCKRNDRLPILEGLMDFGFLLLLSLLLVRIVLSDNPYLLFPLSLLSAFGALMLLTIVYSMVWVMLSRSEGLYQNFSEFLNPLLAGLIMALSQILVIDFLRYSLTGTWGEFPLG
jgi:uncharacterized membrane protein